MSKTAMPSVLAATKRTTVPLVAAQCFFTKRRREFALPVPFAGPHPIGNKQVTQEMISGAWRRVEEAAYPVGGIYYLGSAPLLRAVIKRRTAFCPEQQLFIASRDYGTARYNRIRRHVPYPECIGVGGSTSEALLVANLTPQKGPLSNGFDTVTTKRTICTNHYMAFQATSIQVARVRGCQYYLHKS